MKNKRIVKRYKLRKWVKITLIILSLATITTTLLLLINKINKQQETIKEQNKIHQCYKILYNTDYTSKDCRKYFERDDMFITKKLQNI